MYNAFISTPVGFNGATGFNVPSGVDMTMPAGVQSMVRADLSDGDVGYNNYMSSMSPEQNRMRLEDNPNIQTVVVYNQETGARWFDVIDSQTGASVPNITKPSDFLLEDTTIDVRNGIARNTNLDTTYPLMTIGNNQSIMEY